MNFLKKILLIIFSVFILGVPLNAMDMMARDIFEHVSQYNIFIMFCSEDNSNVLVLGKYENNLWTPIHDKIFKQELENKPKSHSVAMALLDKKSKIIETNLPKISVDKLISKAANIAHQQTFGLFFKKEKKLTSVSDVSEGSKFFENRIIKEQGYLVDFFEGLAIFFIKVPYIESKEFQDYCDGIDEKSSSGESAKKESFIWIKLEDLGKYVFDNSALEELLKNDGVKETITSLLGAHVDSDVKAQAVENSDDDDSDYYDSDDDDDDKDDD